MANSTARYNQYWAAANSVTWSFHLLLKSSPD